MKNLSFKVSAKTARLFGRDNASKADAAVCELIKNTYDADASKCVVCFLPSYLSTPNKITTQEYEYLLLRGYKIDNFYRLNDNTFAELINSEEELKDTAYKVIRQLVDLWIVDNGTGMSAETIETCWMVIGTNDKEINKFSNKGRARSGAKGIGRFALDRLGNCGTLYSTSAENGTFQSIEWRVDWSEFDEKGKVLDEISAYLDDDAEPLHSILLYFRAFPEIASILWNSNGQRIDWSTGTAIRIGLLRDAWARQEMDRLFKTLGNLVPPIEQKELRLFLLDFTNPNRYGEVSPAILEDYDYRLDAAINSAGNISFNLFRNELDRSRIDPKLFTLEEMKLPPFNESSLQQTRLCYDKSLATLFPGAHPTFFERVKELGPFDVKLLYYKRGAPSRRDANIYPYRTFQAGPRKTWLEEFGGIKIYRDNFAVRPYGEHNGRAFDWLALGQRVALNPVAASRKGWKVSPQNLAGTIVISRQYNGKLDDQTNREGIIENEHFAVFREIVLRVIREFENDRSHLLYNFSELYKQKNKHEQAKQAGKKAASRIVKSPSKATKRDAKKLAEAFVAQETEIQELKDEQAMLRALATLGTVLVSFSHELGQLQNTMGSRSSELANILTSYISPDDVAGVSPPFHPYTILEEWAEDDKRIGQWFTFALSSVDASRRRRKNVSLRDHLMRTSRMWNGFLRPREVALTIRFKNGDKDAMVLAFEIDLDSIFNNLILNSVEALLSPRHVGSREIDINVSVAGKLIKVDYRDNGPGLHPSIEDPARIFQFSETTKVGIDGKVNGTGLGMWIVATVVQTYGGTYRAYRERPQKGFRMEFTLPLTKQG